MNSKLAFCFLTYGGIHHEDIWCRLLDEMEGRYSMYAHVKWPERLTQESLLRSCQIRTHLDTEWGRCSLVQAELVLFAEALEDPDNTKLVLVSDSCIPIKKCEHIRTQLSADDLSWIAIEQPGRRRLGRYYGGVDRSRIPLKCFATAPQWVALNRRHAELLLAPDLTQAFLNATCPDEHYIPTFLLMAGVDFDKEVHRRPVTYTDWTRDGSHPRTFDVISRSDVAALQTAPELFARKFTQTSDIAQYWSLITGQEAP